MVLVNSERLFRLKKINRLIFVTKKFLKICLHFHFILASLINFEYTFASILVYTTYTCYTLRNFVYIPLNLLRPQCCLAWKELTKLTVLYTLLNMEQEILHILTTGN